MFTIIVEHGKDDGHGGMTVTIGKLRLVDLAGSERYVQCYPMDDTGRPALNPYI